MNYAALAAWLQRCHRGKWLSSLAKAGLSLFAGIAASSFFLLLFWGGIVFLIPRAYGSPAAFAAAVVGWAIFNGLLIWDAAHTSRDDFSNVVAWLFRETFGLGPRLLLDAFIQFRYAVTWKPLDADLTARVLVWIAGRHRAVPRLDVATAFPDVPWNRIKANLEQVAGVLFLDKDQSRVMILTPLRLRLAAFGAIPNPPPGERPKAAPRREAEPEPEPERRRESGSTRAVEPEQLQPHEILGVRPDATPAEIKAAYRIRVKECHPDRFATMDQASRNLAEEWTKALNAAYARMLENTRQARTSR